MIIQNYKLYDIVYGHYDTIENCVLIQIQDPAHSFPIPKNDYFEQTYQFGIPDLEWGYEVASDLQEIESLKQTIEYLVSANMNIIVHCSAGVSRSGAVVERAIDLGYEDPKLLRVPNLKLLKLLRGDI